MHNTFLSNIELYYSEFVDQISGTIKVVGEEAGHILKVMRHKSGDVIYLTDGNGKIFKSKITDFGKHSIDTQILEIFTYDERYPNITMCLPVLRSNDRFEFALEKCTELGITKFIIYNAERSIKKHVNRERISKIILSAMKQSLMCWLPKIEYLDAIERIVSKPETKIIFEHGSPERFENKTILHDQNYLFIFGPEGGFSHNERHIFSTAKKFSLANNRLRTETAIIKAASLI